MAYRVTITPPADKAIARLSIALRVRIADRLVMLADDPQPHGSLKLQGTDAYRIRVGDYRIVYTIEDARLLVLVVDVGHRGDVYRRL